MRPSLTEIIKEGLCCGCGTCAGVCPSGAIEMSVSEGLFKPKINEDLCSGCQLCQRSCPGASVNFKALQLKIFGRRPEYNEFGNYLACYVGYSTDDQIRFDSASGGVITQLLIFALNNKLIDGAIVTRMRKDNPLEPETFVARTAVEVVEASKSKYCPVATNACLSQVLKEEGRFAIVGLPCHLHGLRKAEIISKTIEKRIVLSLGLFCSHTVGFAGSYFLLEKMGINKNYVKRLAYRGQGWPGYLSIDMTNGSEKKVPLISGWNAYWTLFSSFFFTPMRCTMCPDHAAELSDISFGDAWLPELNNDKKGVSLVISRTIKGHAFIEMAVNAKAIHMRPIRVEKVLESCFSNTKFKKEDLASRLCFMHMIGKATPSFNPEGKSRYFASTFRTSYVYFGIKASSNKRFRSFLMRVPFPLIRLYCGVYKLLCKI